MGVVPLDSEVYWFWVLAERVCVVPLVSTAVMLPRLS